MKAPKAESKPRELVPEGNHVARLYGITYLGTLETPYLKDPDQPELGNKKQFRVRLNWELPNELRTFEKDGEERELPMSLSREVTFSLYKGKQTAVLRTIAHALIGQGLTDEEADNFDIDELLGMACMVEVAHETIEANGRIFAKAVGFGSLPKGMDVPAPINERKIHNVQLMSESEIDAMPEFIRDKMKSSVEYQSRNTEPVIEGTDVDGASTFADEIDPKNIPF